MSSTTESEPLVSVCCLTYNHASTIAEAIEGVLAQQTAFSLELIVHDDASQDGTAAIIRDYADRFPAIIRPIYQQENQYHLCNLAETFLRPKIRGKYVAICEGDDYWTDPAKLQLQVDYMEKHPECALCFHAVTQRNADGTEMPYRPLKESGEVPAEQVIRRGGMFCPSVSLLFRRDVMERWPQFRKEADVYDYPTQVLAATMGKVYYMDRTMGVYRYAQADSWTAQRYLITDHRHLENETHWLALFDDYTGGRYRTAIDYHMAHLWFTEYRKSVDPAAKKQVKKYLPALRGRERAAFGAWMLIFGVCGRRANRLWDLFKKYLLK